MNLKTRFVRRVAAVLAIVLASTIGFIGEAQAADNMPGSPPSSCPGGQIDDNESPKSKTIGSNKITLYIYYSSANGGTNCVIARKSGSWYGSPTWLNLRIWRADSAPSGSWPYAAYDRGRYSYYAGAAYIQNTNGRCIDVSVAYGGSLNDEDGELNAYNIACD